jgi:hypothetical protein
MLAIAMGIEGVEKKVVPRSSTKERVLSPIIIETFAFKAKAKCSGVETKAKLSSSQRLGGITFFAMEDRGPET